jgi:hypothetical protein
VSGVAALYSIPVVGNVMPCCNGATNEQLLFQCKMITIVIKEADLNLLKTLSVVFKKINLETLKKLRYTELLRICKECLQNIIRPK